jgi:cardiolipin synthase
MHQKVMLVDDHIATVGTHNFDNRSFRLNFEVTSIIIDESFGSEVEAMFERDFEHSAPIDPEAWDENSIWWRIGVQLSRLAAPVL